jgi:hypothetical protein
MLDERNLFHDLGVKCSRQCRPLAADVVNSKIASDVCFYRRRSFHQLGARYPDREGFRFGRGGVGVADRPRFTPPSGLATRAVTGGPVYAPRRAPQILRRIASKR